MNKKKRILYIINNLGVGGAEILLSTICKGLITSKSPFDFRVVLLEDIKDNAPEFDRLGVPVHCLHIRNTNYFDRIKKLYAYIRNYRPHIVHTHLLASDGPGQTAAFLACIKNRICSIHNMEIKRNYKDKITRILTSLFATKLIAVSHCAKKFCVENKLYPSNKVTVIYNAPGFGAGSVTPKSIEGKDRIQLINVDRLFDQKGHIYQVKAMKEIEKHSGQVELSIYGDGPEKGNLIQELEREEIKKIDFKGVTSNVKSALEMADIFIASSLWEGFHMSVVEAMSVGLPVIVTDIPPHRELLQDIEDYPLIIPPADGKAIANAVLTLIKSPELFKKLSSQCLEQSKKFSISKMIENYDRFYKSLVKQKLAKKR